MKVLLTYPYKFDPKDTEKIQAPSGLFTLAALGRNKGWDSDVLRLNGNNIVSVLKKQDPPDVFGISMLTSNRHIAMETAEAAKTLWPETIVIAGGPHATPLAEELAERFHFLDHVIAGEGENSLLNVLDSLEQGRMPEVKVIHPEDLFDLNELPNSASGWIYGNILTSRGCPGNCHFCATPELWGRKIRFRPATMVLDEIEALVRNYGLTSLAISDDMFTADIQRATAILQGIIKRDIRVRLDVRFRAVNIDESFARLMRKAGVVSAGMGLESADKTVLNGLNKAVNYDALEETTRKLQNEGIRVNLFVITGAPGEDRTSFDKTVKKINELNPDFITPAILHIFPGTQLEKTAQENGMKIDWFSPSEDESAPLFTLQAPIGELKRRYEVLASWEHKVSKKFPPKNNKNASASKSPEKYESKDKNQSLYFDDLDCMAEKMEAAGDYDGALEARAAACDLLPAPELSFKLGETLLMCGMPMEAKHYIENAVQKWTTEKCAGLRQFPPQATALGIALCRLGRWQDARDQFEYACELSPDDWIPFAWLSMTFESLDDEQLSKKFLVKAKALYRGKKSDFSSDFNQLFG